MRKNWTHHDRIIVFGLYCELPFGKFHQRHPRVIQVAQALDRTPSSVAMKLSNFASLDPVITSSGRKGLSGASQADKEFWQSYTESPSTLIEEVEEALTALSPPAEPESEPQQSLQDYSAESVPALTQRRKGQGIFRKAVLSAYHYQCCVTGVSDQRLLVASHIRRWSDDPENRLNPSNGLCLSSFFDRAFDAGLITFDKDYRLKISPALKHQESNQHIAETFLAREGVQMKLPDKFSPSPVFLNWHRESWFITG